MTEKDQAAAPPGDLVGATEERNRLAYVLKLIGDQSPSRPIVADELEDVLMHGKQVEDDYESAFRLLQWLANQALTPELRAAADAQHKADIRAALASAERPGGDDGGR